MEAGRGSVSQAWYHLCMQRRSAAYVSDSTVEKTGAGVRMGKTGVGLNDRKRRDRSEVKREGKR